MFHSMCFENRRGVYKVKQRKTEMNIHCFQHPWQPDQGVDNICNAKLGYNITETAYYTTLCGGLLA